MPDGQPAGNRGAVSPEFRRTGDRSESGDNAPASGYRAGFADCPGIT
jgi:hypothetical protein